MYILGPCGSLQQAVLQGWEFLPPPQVPQVFTVKGIEAFFPCAGTLGCTVCLAPQLFLSIYLHTDVGPPSLPATTLTCILSAPPPVWMNASSLTPWLSDFHTVKFSGSSDYFLLLNLLLSFFWLCEQAKYIYLLLHLGWKSWYTVTWWRIHGSIFFSLRQEVWALFEEGTLSGPCGRIVHAIGPTWVHSS